MGEDVECPTCGKDGFNDKTAMRRHHSMAHGESIAKTDVECEFCESDFEVHERRKDSAKFCSENCRYQWQSENVTGENHHNYKRTELECDQCGDEFSIQPYRVNQGRRFCSKECVADYHSERDRKDVSIDYECDWCGDSIELLPYELEYHDHHFCDVSCRAEHYSENHRGEEHHLWKPDSGDDYGEGWNEDKREKVRNRDDRKCQSCGKTEQSEIEDYGTKLSVHHIRRKDQTDNFNGMKNLVTLCKSCHKRWEGIPLRPKAGKETV